MLLGFRSNKLWKKILSVMYLGFVGFAAIGLLIDSRQGQITVYDFWIDKLYSVVMLMWMLSPYIFLSNTKFRDKLPLFKKHKVGASMVGLAIVGFIILILSGVVNGLHSEEYLADMENHAYKEKVTVAATCEKDGELENYCEYCGISTTETIKATGHTWDTGSPTTEATCTEVGIRTYTCTTCKDTKTEEIKALGHTWNLGEIATEATCTTDGVGTYTCTVCSTTKTKEIIKALGHSWDSGNITTPATCTTDGITTYTCTACNTTKTEGIKALGHSWDSGNITTAVTCATDGITTYTCISCNTTKTEGIKALGHKWEKATCETPSICNNCGDTKDSALGHTTDCGICSRCNKELRKQSPVTILNWTYTIDYVGGVEWNFRIRNNTDKQIKYVTMQWNCYNAVGDLIRDQIDGKSYVRLRFTGPLDAYATSGSKRNTTKFYNHNLTNYQMTEVIVEYMDGTTEKVTSYHDNILG